jgi:hypothetical protein
VSTEPGQELFKTWLYYSILCRIFIAVLPLDCQASILPFCAVHRAISVKIVDPSIFQPLSGDSDRQDWTIMNSIWVLLWKHQPPNFLWSGSLSRLPSRVLVLTQYEAPYKLGQFCAGLSKIGYFLFMHGPHSINLTDEGPSLGIRLKECSKCVQKRCFNQVFNI